MKRHLQYNWFKYLAVIILPILFWNSVFDVLAKPKQNEQLRILYVGDLLDAPSLQADVQDAIPQLTEQTIREVTVTQAVPNGMSYFDFLTAQCFHYDILILSQSWCRENTGQGAFVQLPQAILDAFPNTPVYTETVEQTPLAYGLTIYDGTVQNRFSMYYHGNKNCYLFFSPESVNLAAKNGKGIVEDDAALKVAQYLLEAIH